MVPSDSQIHANLVLMMGPGNGAQGLPQRRDARRRMISELERLLPDYGIPPGGDLLGGATARTAATIDRRSVYAGITTPTLYQKLEHGLHTEADSRDTERAVMHYQRGLVRAEPIIDDLHFLTVVISREHDTGLTAYGDRMVPNTFTHGGLDHLGAQMRRMSFVPRAVIRRWIDLGPGTGCENLRPTSCHPIHAASIPAADEMVAYAGVLRLAYDGFCEKLESEFGGARSAQMLNGITSPQRRAWTQLAFARVNGVEYAPETGPEMFASDTSGLVTILDAAHYYESTESTAFSLQSIFTEPRFRRMTSVRIAQARAVEAAVLDTYGLLANGYQFVGTTMPATADPPLR